MLRTIFQRCSVTHVPVETEATFKVFLIVLCAITYGFNELCSVMGAAFEISVKVE